VIKLRFPFIPKEEKFFDLLEESARNVVKGAKLLSELMNKWEDVESKIRHLKDIEHDGDEITHRIISQLHATFVTPIDREDIAQLAEYLDDVLDFIEEVAAHMLIYKVKRPSERAQELADILVKTASEVSAAIPMLRSRNTLNKLPEHFMEINRLENEADTVQRAAMAELFSDELDLAGVIRWMKWRDIYDHMENATDRCEDIANVLEGVMIKRA
jgi:predicted phosphate transport protein (TIGR00153 family)